MPKKRVYPDRSEKYLSAQALAVKVNVPVDQVVRSSMAVCDLAKQMNVDISSIMHRVKTYGGLMYPGFSNSGNAAMFLYDYERFMDDHYHVPAQSYKPLTECVDHLKPRVRLTAKPHDFPHITGVPGVPESNINPFNKVDDPFKTQILQEIGTLRSYVDSLAKYVSQIVYDK